tara:strand:+ start:336 stop:497 length:162 start_codon:yes stop_codon:yes gene_type:complete
MPINRYIHAMSLIGLIGDVVAHMASADVPLAAIQAINMKQGAAPKFSPWAMHA